MRIQYLPIVPLLLNIIWLSSLTVKYLTKPIKLNSTGVILDFLFWRLYLNISILAGFYCIEYPSVSCIKSCEHNHKEICVLHLFFLMSKSCTSFEIRNLWTWSLDLTCLVGGYICVLCGLNVEVVFGLSPHQMMDECVMNIFTLSHFSLSHVRTQVNSCWQLSLIWETSDQQLLSCLSSAGT